MTSRERRVQRILTQSQTVTETVFETCTEKTLPATLVPPKPLPETDHASCALYIRDFELWKKTYPEEWAAEVAGRKAFEEKYPAFTK